MQSPTRDFFLWRLFGLEPTHLSATERTLLRAALAIGAFVALWSYRDINTYAGVDLRNRVVGARVMLAGYDPYTFVWESGMPEEWLDPVYDPKAHRLTITPPMLLVYAPLAPLPYSTIRFLSLLAEWTALIASLALLARSLSEQRYRAIFLVGATLFVIATDVWRLHVERGQIYVFQLLALSVAIYCSRVGAVDSLAAGAALGVLGLMRPNLLVMAPGLLLMRQWRAFGSLTGTVGIGLTIAFLMLPTSSWPSYLDVGEQYYRVLQNPDAVSDRPRPVEHGRAEGVDFDRALNNVESSSFAVAWQTMRQHADLPAIHLALTSKILMAGLAGLLLIIAGIGRASFAAMIVLAMDTDFFLPHRFGYVDVMLLAPVAMVMPALLKHPWAMGIVAVGLVSGPMGQMWFGLQIATILRSWLVMAALTAIALLAPSTPGERGRGCVG